MARNEWRSKRLHQTTIDKTAIDTVASQTCLNKRNTENLISRKKFPANASKSLNMLYICL